MRPAPLITIAAVVLTAGCASTGATSSAPDPAAAASSSSAAAAASSSAAAIASAASAAANAPCTTKACIAEDAESLKSGVAKDNSVMTSITCKKSTVKQVVPGTYTVHCTASYSDGYEYRGIASVLIGADKVDWEPTSIIKYGDGG